jgi:hypothetical protein
MVDSLFPFGEKRWGHDNALRPAAGVICEKLLQISREMSELGCKVVKKVTIVHGR